MHLIHDPKITILALLSVQLTCLHGRDDQAMASSNLARNGSPAVVDQSAPDNQSKPGGDYWGEDWANQKSSPPKSDGSKTSNSKPANAADAEASNSLWTLVIGTFSDPGHEDAARQMLLNLPKVAPQISGARIHTTPHGSMVVYGSYTGRDDPRATHDQEWLKSLQYGGHPVFNRVILTRIDLRTSKAQLHPYDLLSARKAHPNVDPLYTLDVAIWMSNPDPKAGRDRITYDEVKKKSEAYAAELRAKGEEAYFYHDDAHQWSVVTVGLFDRRAVDPRSGLYSADVDQLIRKFPVRLANGEPLMEFKDRLKPSAGTRPQVPKLVLVPMM